MNAPTRFGMILLALGAIGAPHAYAADIAKTCQPTFQSARTEFPADAQEIGAHGSVQVRVQIDSTGKAHALRVVNSSGYGSLDRAALNSINKYWRFNIESCAASNSNIESTVSVRFDPPTRVTASGTVDVRSVRLSNSLRANSNCSADDKVSGTTVFSCVNQEAAQNAQISGHNAEKEVAR
ncbi:MAG TPA: energy transducer TonB [Steroidobacteraceae bacterium]|nr:energy transducer TonB [Steroidobacteraceae bacterium]